MDPVVVTMIAVGALIIGMGIRRKKNLKNQEREK